MPPIEVGNKYNIAIFFSISRKIQIRLGVSCKIGESEHPLSRGLCLIHLDKGTNPPGIKTAPGKIQFKFKSWIRLKIVELLFNYISRCSQTFIVSIIYRVLYVFL